MIVRIKSRQKPEETKKALKKLSRARKKKKKKLSDFYGKMPGSYGDPLAYQKSIRDEWR